MYYFKESYASRTALASWSGQEVGFLPHFMPLTFFSICSTVSPSTSERTAWRFPLHPPVKFTLVIISPSISNSINEEQVPFVHNNLISARLSWLYYIPERISIKVVKILLQARIVKAGLPCCQEG